MTYAHSTLALAAAALLGCNTAAAPASVGALGATLPKGALPPQTPAASAPAAPDGAVKDRIAGLLDGFEDTPSKEALLANGDEAAVTAALASIAHDASQPTIRRLRAVSLLGFFPSDATKQALESALKDSPLIRREATTAYGNAFGPSSVDRLSELASHDDPFTRVVAIKALGRIGSAPARAAIEARERVEKVDVVRQAARTELARRSP